MFSFPFKSPDYFINTFLHTAGGNLESLRCYLAWLVCILQPKLIGVDSCNLGKLIKRGFNSEGRLRVSITSHSLAVCVVRVDTLRRILDIWYLIE